MGSRLKASNAVIVDLDRTLVTVNTFREYTIFACRMAIRRLRLLTAMSMATAVAMRKARMISHGRMKLRILRTSEPIMNERLLMEFSVLIAKHFNPIVIKEITRLKEEGISLILASAAPESYASLIARLANIDYHIATPASAAADWKECVGEEKKSRVLKLLREMGLNADGIMTDHLDDLPLMRLMSGKITLVSPKKETLDAVNAEGLSYKIV